jgi:hypothetical protein
MEANHVWWVWQSFGQGIVKQSAKGKILYLFGNIVITRFVACGDFFFQIKKIQVTCYLFNW